jgi:recombination protein RecT
MTQTVGNAVAKTEPVPIALLTAHRDRYAAVLPDHIEVKAFVGLASGALYRDPKLMEAATSSPASFANALMRCASLGHQPASEEFYLIPRRIKGKMEIQGIEGYRGIVERMYRSGAVASVIVREVCANDTFNFVEGVHDRPEHHIDWFGGTRGDMIGVYAYAVLTTGAVSRVAILSRDDVMAAKAKSDGASSDYSPWNTNERAMWWKTAARRLEPWVPTSAEFRREVLRATAEAGLVQRDGGVLHQPGVDPVTGEVDDTIDADVVETEIPVGQGNPDEAQA